MAADVAQPALQAVDAAQQAASVHLQLGLAGTSRADSPRLLAQPVAGAAQPRQPVPQLRQLHLHLALHAGGVLGEYVQDDRRPVDRRPAQHPLEIALLGGTQLVVEHHGVGIAVIGDIADLLRLARSHVGGRVGAVPALHHPLHRIGPGRVHEASQFLQ